MPPISANPRYQRLLEEINNFYFRGHIDRFENLNSKTVGEALTAITKNGDVHQNVTSLFYVNMMARAGEEKLPISVSKYVNSMDKAIDDWIRKNPTYITSKEELEDAFKRFSETRAYKSIESNLKGGDLKNVHEEVVLEEPLLFNYCMGREPLASTSFQGKVLLHQQRELMKKLEDGSFQRGNKVDAWDILEKINEGEAIEGEDGGSNDRRAFQYGLTVLLDRNSRVMLSQNNSCTWSEIGGCENDDELEENGRMLTNIFLDGAEFKTIRSMGASFSESEKKFINNIRRINEGEMSGFNTESSRIASLLNEKYLAKKEAGIIKAAAENLKYRTHSLSIGKWTQKSEAMSEKLEEIRGTFSPLKHLTYSIRKAYYDRRLEDSEVNEKNSGKTYEKAYIDSDSKFLLASQNLNEFCLEKGIVSGRNAKLNNEDLKIYSSLLNNVGEAGLEARLRLGINKRTVENPEELMKKTNDIISRKVTRNALNSEEAKIINAERCDQTKEFLKTFESKEQVTRPVRVEERNMQEQLVESQPIVPEHNPVSTVINSQESVVIQQAQNTAPAPSQILIQQQVETNSGN